MGIERMVRHFLVLVVVRFVFPSKSSFTSLSSGFGMEMCTLPYIEV